MFAKNDEQKAARKQKSCRESLSKLLFKLVSTGSFESPMPDRKDLFVKRRCLQTRRFLLAAPSKPGQVNSSVPDFCTSPDL